MTSPHALIWFLGAALVLAAMPGPGLLYVTGRTLAAGRADGFASCFGTLVGGLVHVVAGAAGVSAVLMASAQAFVALKFCGGAYLLYLAVQTWRAADRDLLQFAAVRRLGACRAFRQAIVVEALNPKTAAFFLAFIPEFIDVGQGHVAIQFLGLGLISVALNTGADVIAVMAASFFRSRLTPSGKFRPRVRKGSAAMLAALGIYFMVAERPA